MVIFFNYQENFSLTKLAKLKSFLEKPDSSFSKSRFCAPLMVLGVVHC